MLDTKIRRQLTDLVREWLESPAGRTDKKDILEEAFNENDPSEALIEELQRWTRAELSGYPSLSTYIGAYAAELIDYPALAAILLKDHTPAAKK